MRNKLYVLRPDRIQGLSADKVATTSLGPILMSTSQFVEYADALGSPAVRDTKSQSDL